MGTMLTPAHVLKAAALAAFFMAALLAPIVGKAQVFQFKTPEPEVTAASADWQVNSEPIIVGGLIFSPARETRFFDGEIMAQVGAYRGVPVYADVTELPWGTVYVPVGRNLMRAYVRTGEAGTGLTGTGMPSGGIPSGVGTSGTLLTPMSSTAPIPTPEPEVSLSGGDLSVNIPPLTALTRPARVESIPHPKGINGVWVEYEGARWYSDGPAVALATGRFSRIGEYQGFPVYRAQGGGGNEIWIAVVNSENATDVPVAPFAKRG